MHKVDDNALTRMLSAYRDPTTTKKDVINVLRIYHGLQHRIEEYVFNDGNTKLLLNLHGTIPVKFKGNTYNIPICIWLMDTHPKNAPICYVKPTAEMRIKVSSYVDFNGKIYLPYLHDWNPKNADLLDLIQIMTVTFGELPPVYSKGPDTYPKQPSFMPPTSTSYMPAYPAQAYPPYPVSGAGYNNYGQPTPGLSTGATGQGYLPYGMPSYPTPMSTTPAINQGTGTITEEHIRASLISAVEDKLKRRVQEKVNQCQAEIQTLKRTQLELNEGQVKIQDLVSRLQRDEQELTKSIAVLKDKEKELERELGSLEQVDTIDVDEAVTTTAPLYKQLLNAYAEEAAIEDATYFMGEALRSGVIDLEVFLKQIRQLSRKQFMLRALMQKCRQKAGLSG
ncbi:tumor susceptibility gene 101 protein [Anopheles bellator]|uniref:tumor susceptibility gene 101 protein n=1 Tax=Anopheles bellator TaxID=139047 RepID=UPI002648B7C1|nr:tumor susceptibility gene 101 protein [Anopheles bellator]